MPRMRVETYWEQADIYRSGLSAVIDLTSSDAEDALASASCRATEALPSAAQQLLNGAEIDITSDGLILEGPLSCLTLKNGPFRHTRPLPETMSRPNQTLKSGSISNPAKRRRIEPGTTKERPFDLDRISHYSPEVSIPDRTLTKCSTHLTQSSTLAEALHARVHLNGGDKWERERRMNENLSKALREQVFPHINQRLDHYKRSIDRGTRRQLGKKAASKICGDEFLDNLDRNNGSLSPSFEGKVAAMARSIVDQLTKEALADLADADTDSHIDLVNSAPPQVKDTSTKAIHGERRTVNNGPKDHEQSRREKLSAIMKARWASGSMDIVMATKVARNARKRARMEALENPPGHPGQKQALAPLAARQSVMNLDSSTSSDGGIRRVRPARSLRKSYLMATQTLRKPLVLTGSGPKPPRKGLQQRKIVILKVKSAIRLKESQTLNIRSAKLKVEDLRLLGLDERVSRPYLSLRDKKDIQQGLAISNSKAAAEQGHFERGILSLQDSLLHVDFFKEEIQELITAIELITSRDTKSQYPNPYSQIQAVTRDFWGLDSLLSGRLASDRPVFLKSRTNASVIAFLNDASTGTIFEETTVSRINLDQKRVQGSRRNPDSLSSIIQQRQTWGRRRHPHNCTSFKARMLSLMEDQFVREAEWTDCAGDIATISWLDCDRFFCGATAHSDEHNMQYNKPGNLVTGSVVAKTLKSVAGHQIVRPIVTKGENSRASMRETQDPWMYCSVTSTAYSYDNKKCFSGSYDQTVKVWDIADDGSSMELCGVWEHAGNVNFVVASPHHSLVATAADVREDAVRVYHFDARDISCSNYNVYEASVQHRNSHDNWAYFPSTIQWGVSPSVAHLLLVGYSPRSFDGNDADIPEEKLNTGELCLWNVTDGNRVVITSARTQNVFEVVWHPSQPIFIAATSPTGDFEDGINTQLRVFGQTNLGAFCVLKTLDCPARDINEVTLMPNSNVDCYVTASCTNSRTYVWDSAVNDKPIHILRHGESIDEQTIGNSMEETDSGVKFAAWGRTCDRFYTGSSDGVVKAWNIRAPSGRAFIRDVICLSGGVSSGKFSPNFSSLILGDATGKIHLLSFGGFEQPGSETSLRRPITPHPPLSPPLIDEDDQEIDPPKTARERAQQFLDRRQIIICEDEYIGAVQGPNYASTNLFYDSNKFKAENGEHSSGWSMSELIEKQQSRLNPKCIDLARIPKIGSSCRWGHDRNLALDPDATATFPSEMIRELESDGIDLNFEDRHEYEVESGTLIDGTPNSGKIIEGSGLLDSFEIEEFWELKGKISEELAIQKALKALLL